MSKTDGLWYTVTEQLLTHSLLVGDQCVNTTGRKELLPSYGNSTYKGPEVQINMRCSGLAVLTRRGLTEGSVGGPVPRELGVTNLRA